MQKCVLRNAMCSLPNTKRFTSADNSTIQNHLFPTWDWCWTAFCMRTNSWSTCKHALQLSQVSNKSKEIQCCETDQQWGPCEFLARDYKEDPGQMATWWFCRREVNGNEVCIDWASRDSAGDWVKTLTWLVQREQESEACSTALEQPIACQQE